MLWLVRGIGAATAAILGGPALVTLLSPMVRHRRVPLWQPIGPMDEFEVGQMHKRTIELPEMLRTRTVGTKGVFVWKEGEEQVIVFARNCTDLSCPVTWDPGSGRFFCPCHGGIFSQEGDPVAGPPSMPLFRYQTRVRDGVLEVDLRSLPPMT
jgi:menaquinol-cytochrome c reductase iron-sulfur subunit